MKRFFSLLLAFVWATLLNAQSFTVEHGDLAKTDSIGSEIIFEFQVKNVSNSDLTLDLLRTKNDLPENWSSSLCFSLCFAPFMDSVSTTSDFGSSPLAPNEVRTFSAHVFPFVNEGTAHLTIVVKNHNNPSDKQEFEITATAQTTDVENSPVAQGFYLSQAYPNPFGEKSPAATNNTQFKFTLPAAGFTQLKIYDVLGREIATLVNGSKRQGTHTVEFNAGNIPAGIYFARFSANGIVQTRKFVLEK